MRHRKNTSDVTPSKLYARYLRACDHMEELQARGTRVSGYITGFVSAKHKMFLAYQSACTIRMHHPQRAARCQELLDAAEWREHVNEEASRTQARRQRALAAQKEQKERRKQKELSERLDRLYPPIFEQPRVAALTSEEREVALDEIDSFNTTPVLWVGLRSKRRRPADESPEPCDNCCGVCEYCQE